MGPGFCERKRIIGLERTPLNAKTPNFDFIDSNQIFQSLKDVLYKRCRWHRNAPKAYGVWLWRIIEIKIDAISR